MANEPERVRRQVSNDAWKAGVQAGHGNCPATDKAHEAAREAVADFERCNPEAVFKFNEPQSRMQVLIKKVKAGTR